MASPVMGYGSQVSLLPLTYNLLPMT